MVDRHEQILIEIQQAFHTLNTKINNFDERISKIERALQKQSDKQNDKPIPNCSFMNWIEYHMVIDDNCVNKFFDTADTNQVIIDILSATKQSTGICPVYIYTLRNTASIYIYHDDLKWHLLTDNNYIKQWSSFIGGQLIKMLRRKKDSQRFINLDKYNMAIKKLLEINIIDFKRVVCDVFI
tara:strand:- start:27 stop:572 length:546 start_codon:yes stop_codon:yes gene_type:complete